MIYGRFASRSASRAPAGAPDGVFHRTVRRRSAATTGTLVAGVLAAILGNPGLGAAQTPPTVPSVTQERPVPPFPTGQGWIGIGVQVTERPDAPPRVTISYVWPESPAAAAGILLGDQVTAVNGVPIAPEQFRSLTRRLVPGDPIQLRMDREGRSVEVNVVAGEAPPRELMVRARLQEELEEVRERMARILTAEELALVDAESGVVLGEAGAPTIIVEGSDGQTFTTRIVRGLNGDSTERPVRISWQGQVERATEAIRELGLGAFSIQIEGEEGELARPLAPFIAGANRVAGAEVRPMNAGLAAYFQVDQGILITSVAAGTPAAEAGLRSGDVVVSVGGTPIATVEAFRRVLADRRAAKELLVVRRGESVTLTIR